MLSTVKLIFLMDFVLLSLRKAPPMITDQYPLTPRVARVVEAIDNHPPGTGEVIPRDSAEKRVLVS